MCQGELHCWELLKLINDTCPKVKDVTFHLDCCGAAGAFWQATKHRSEFPNIIRAFFKCAVAHDEMAMSMPDGSDYTKAMVVNRAGYKEIKDITVDGCRFTLWIASETTCRRYDPNAPGATAACLN